MILVSSRNKVGFAEKHQVVFHEENTDGREWMTKKYSSDK
jgi:hypothetical protein